MKASSLVAAPVALILIAAARPQSTVEVQTVPPPQATTGCVLFHRPPDTLCSTECPDRKETNTCKRTPVAYWGVDGTMYQVCKGSCSISPTSCKSILVTPPHGGGDPYQTCEAEVCDVGCGLVPVQGGEACACGGSPNP